MAFNVDNAVGQFLPWDFPVEVGGVTYPTRPILFGEIITLSAGAGERLRELVLGLFAGDDKPDLSGWTMDHVQAFVAAIQDYATERAKKNAPVMRKILASR